MRNKKNTNSKWFFYSVIFVIVLIIAEITSYLGIYVYGIAFPGRPILQTKVIYDDQSNQVNKLINGNLKLREVIHAELGWKVKPGYNTRWDQINLKGLRSNREYSREPNEKTIRIAAFGDSFIFGSEVPNKDSWSSIVERDYKNIEILNYGVPGYGTDQAFLRYQNEGKDLNPKIVIIGFAPVNLRRSVNRYRRFMSPSNMVFFKPRFVLDKNDKIRLLKNPINSKSDYKKLLNNPKMILDVGENDQWYEPAIYENPLYDLSATVRLATTVWLRIYNRYFDENRILDGSVFNRKSEAFKVQTQLIEHFVKEVKKDKKIPVVVILPSEIMISDARNGKPKVYDPVVSYLLEKGIRVEDMMDAFLKQNNQIKEETWFMRRHYSPIGNKVIGDWIVNKIVTPELEKIDK